jgi:hypothetical protein
VHFHVRGCHPLWPVFPDRSINALIWLFTSPSCQLSVVSCHTDPALWQLGDVCGPATPGFPFELPGLGCSEFARHYYRNHGCFLFLRVLRWFTSPGSLRTAMYSPRDTWCSHQVGSPIRISPDHRLCASPRSFSQLTTSFIAFLRLGIPTHALSSLTIKLISNTDKPKACLAVVCCQLSVASFDNPHRATNNYICARLPYIGCTAGLLV